MEERTIRKSTRRRVHQLDRLLRSNGPASLSELAERLGVGERTVRRDLAYIKETMGFPVAWRDGIGFTYADEFLTLPALDERSPLSRRENSSPPADSTRLSANLEAIHGALYAREKLLLRGDLSQEPRLPDLILVYPFFLARRMGDLILFGYRPDLKGLINQPVNRFFEAIRLPETFNERPVVGGEIRLTPEWIPSGTLHRVKLVFAPTARWAEDLWLSEGQVMGHKRGLLSVTFSTDDLESVRRLAVFLGKAVSVEEPAALKSMVKISAKFH